MEGTTQPVNLKPEERARRKAPPPPGVHSGEQQQQHATVQLQTGAELTLTLRQRFQSRSEAKEHVQDFALAQGKRARLDPSASGGKNFTFVCNSCTPCSFVVRVCQRKRSNLPAYFYVSSFRADHGPECTGTEAVTTRQVVSRLMSANAAISDQATTVRAIVQAHDGVNVSARMAYRAKHALTGAMLKDVNAGVQKLESLLLQFQALNPSVKLQMEVGNKSQQFMRAFLMLPHAPLLQRHSLRILGLDGIDMAATSNFNGTFLELATKDGNYEVCTLAVALCDGRTTENYSWFFQGCLDGGLSLDVPMLCDRSPALVRAAESFSGASPILIQCTAHLIRDMETAFKTTLTQELRQLIRHVQNADTKEEFNKLFELLSLADSRVADYLRAVDPEVWATHWFLRRHALYGWQTTSLIGLEDANAALVGILPPFYFFQSYMERSMNALYARKSEAKAWLASGRVLTSYAEEVLQQQQLDGSQCSVSPSDGETGTAYISDTGNPAPRKRRVRLSAGSCSCPYPEQFGLPCKHLCAAAAFFNERGGSWDLAQLCDPLYTVANYVQVYSPQTAPVEIPVDEELARNDAIQLKAPAMKRCSVCKTLGHNKRKCTGGFNM